VPRTVWAVAAAVVMAVIGYGTGALWPDLIRSDRDHMLSEVAKYHSIYSRETVHLVEVPAAQEDHLKAWLGKRVEGTLIIPDFTQARLTFAGGRLVVLDGAPVAELMYTRDGGLPIGFCILHHVGQPDAVTLARRGDINLATWDDGSHSYIVVGEADPAMLRGLAALARQQL
jgi:anti-sigma factor RsiW